MSLKNALLDAVEARGYRLARVRPGEPSDALDRDQLQEFRRLAREAAPGEGTTNLLGAPLRHFGGKQFSHLVSEIWCRQIYKFQPSTDAPRVLDCGANVGLATLYFKELAPKARITSFEADPNVFKALEHNVRGFGYDDVELVNRAVWNCKTELNFLPHPGSTAGRLGDESAAEGFAVETVTLDRYLEEPVDFLKIDIEGAEIEVVNSIADKLGQVRNLFIEYHSPCDGPQRLDELFGVLAKAGLRVWMENGGRPVRTPLTEDTADGAFDMYLNLYARRD